MSAKLSRKEKLEAVYARIPSANCKGFCTEFCNSIMFTRLEADRMNKLAGLKQLPQPTADECPFLKEGRCSVYEARPTVCRLFGVAPGLLCPFGCEPEAILTDAEASSIIHEVEHIGKGRAAIMTKSALELVAELEREHDLEP